MAFNIIRANAPIDTEHQDAPICPNCGAEQKPWEGHQVYTPRCQSCRIQFQVIRHVTVTYSTRGLG